MELLPTQGNPVVYASRRSTNENAPTVLVYGHYDVQPADPYELWQTPPFEPSIRNNRIYARGACDDKGQVYIHVKVLEMLAAQGDVPCHLKFLIEGEEEVGSAHLPAFLAQQTERLACDALLVSDTALISKQCPSITVGIRGIVCMELQLRTASTDLHSGEYGGAIANPIEELSRLLSRLKDTEGVVQIPHFYDDVQPLSSADRAALERIPFESKAYLNSIGAQQLHGEAGYSTYERLGARPTLEINGIWGGYIGEGSKTVLPAQANAKISMRLVPNQDPEKIVRLFEEHVQRLVPPTAKLTVTEHHHGHAALVSTESVAYQAASAAMERVWQQAPIPMRMGGSIPIVSDLERTLNAPVVLMGFGLPADALHAPNESFDLECFDKGMETVAYFYEYLAKTTT